MFNLSAVLRLAGLIMVVIGLVWVGQGTGYFPYPRESFMISQMPWAYRGAVLALAGLIIIIFARRR